jgi:hypothetical protein
MTRKLGRLWVGMEPIIEIDCEVDKTAAVEQQRGFLGNHLHLVSQPGVIYFY